MNVCTRDIPCWFAFYSNVDDTWMGAEGGNDKNKIKSENKTGKQFEGMFLLFLNSV